MTKFKQIFYSLTDVVRALKFISTQGHNILKRDHHLKPCMQR